MFVRTYHYKSPPYTNFIFETKEGKRKPLCDPLNVLNGLLPRGHFLGENGALCLVTFDYALDDRTPTRFENNEVWEDKSGVPLRPVLAETFHLIASVEVSPLEKEIPKSLVDILKKHQYELLPEKC